MITRIRPRGKKGQIQMFETIAVLLVFFVIMGFAIAFYFYISKEGAIKEHQRANELAAITTAQKVSSLPELDCVQVGVHVEKCFDVLKMDAFSRLISSNPNAMEAYYDTIGYAKLTINRIYPSGTPIEIYDKKPITSTTGVSAEELPTEKTFLPINTFDPIKKTYGFAVLEVTFYER